MVSATLKVIGCVFAVCLTVSAQTPAKKTHSGTISGKVTLKGNGLPGVTVGARNTQSSSRANPPVIALTDQEGNYRITNVAPGSYQVISAAPQFVPAGAEP